MDDQEIKTRVLDQLLRDYPDGLIDGGWNYDLLSSNSTLSSEYILDHKNKPWNDVRILCNKNIHSDIRSDIIEKMRKARISIRWSLIALDMDIIKFISNLMEDDYDVKRQIAKNRNLNVEIVEYLYQNDIFDEELWMEVQAYRGPEVLKWIMNVHPELISYGHMVNNHRLDNEIVEIILASHQGYVYELISMGYLTDEAKIDLIEDPSFKPRGYVGSICQSSTPEVFHRMTEYHPLLVKKMKLSNLQSATLDPPAIEWLLTNKVITKRNVRLLKGVDSKILIDIIQANETDPIDLCELVIDSYLTTGDDIDYRVLEHLPLSCKITNSDLILTFREIRWKFTYENSQFHLLAIIPDIINLKKLCTSITSRSIQCLRIKLDYSIDRETLQYLTDHPCDYISWTHLTEITHQDLIISYPHLPWSRDVLSARHYLPSRRMMFTKASKSSNY